MAKRLALCMFVGFNKQAFVMSHFGSLTVILNENTLSAYLLKDQLSCRYRYFIFTGMNIMHLEFLNYLPCKLHFINHLAPNHFITVQMKQMMLKFQTLLDDENVEELHALLSELESLHDTEEEYMVQLETQQKLLLNKINELGQEVINSSPSLTRSSDD